ncbi:MAG: hypothetical protein DHS20C15_11430 [Planctomycetota bacterium]|nr:MAG: hypothetical protein DHS20C15_11430 [Planctomycetota bacterium]
MTRTLLALALLLGAVAPLSAQWDPANGQFGKTDPNDLRVMTYNIEDGICRTAFKGGGFNAWDALGRVVADMQPDVLILQEVGDNSGNGTGSDVDSTSQLATTLELFLHGGTDIFLGGTVGAYVQLHAPTYDLPHIFVSGSTDGFNRNVILSRYPFGDVNADGIITLSDFFQLGDLYSPGTNGGIRGFMHAEIDLPDGIYAGDLVVGNSHLKAGGSTFDKNERRTAAQNIAYYIDAQWNGLGGATADPNSKIFTPGASMLPSAETPWILGGDWNEDESTNGQKGPAEWITRAAATGGSDGTDRDRTDMLYDASTEFFTGNPDTRGSAKLDYLAWQDSIATLRRSFIFNSAVTPIPSLPSAVSGFTLSGQLASGVAADHFPVIADFMLPLAPVCSDPTIDLANGKAGTGGQVPLLSACGALGTGQTADFLLENGLPGAPAYLVLGLSAGYFGFSGGVLVPAPDFTNGPFNLNASGELLLAGVPGGGGPIDIYAQFVVLDAGASFGRALSNAVQIPLAP